MKVCTQLTGAQCFYSLQKDGPTDGFLEVGAIIWVNSHAGHIQKPLHRRAGSKSELDFDFGGIYLLCVDRR